MRPLRERAKSLAALLLWRSGLLALAGRLRRVLRGSRLLVLCYHRIVDDLSLPAVSARPADFAAQVAWLAGRFEILPLAAVEGYLSGRLRLERDAVVLTFDDGYADNYAAALPVLARHRVPATFFIASDPLLRREPYWYDAFWSYLEDWNGQDLPAGFMDALPAPLAAAWARFREEPTRRARQALLDEAKGLPRSRRVLLMDALRGRRKGARPEAACATMTVEEAREASRLGVELGAHTVTHPSLARIPPEDCRAEIEASLADLRSLGLAVRSFAYPFGEAPDVGGPGGHPRRILARSSRDGGVRLAVTTEERPVRATDDPLLVPRKVVTPQSLPRLALRMEVLAWIP